ncbi:MAG: DegV family protein [Actinomycetota bacterium]|nr:DegV family protein [Actinomycetota bacterium]
MAGRVGIVADSACSLGADLAGREGVRLVPMQITLGGRTVSETEVTQAEVVANLGSGLSTAAPSPGAFLRAIQDADQGAGVVVLTVSSKLSATHTAALLASGSTSTETLVVDTMTAAGAEGLVVLAARRAAEAGWGAREVAHRARAAAGQVRLIAAVESLEHLARTGRIPQAAGWAGTHLGLQMMFELSGGRIRPSRPLRGASRADEAMVNRLVQAERPSGARLHVAGLHSCDQQDAVRLLARLERSCRPHTSFVGSFGPVMLAHTGPGMRGLAWLWQPGQASDTGRTPPEP